MLPTPRATDGTDGPVTNCPSVQAICDGSAGRSPRLSEMAAGGLFSDEPGVALRPTLLPTPTASDAHWKTTHAGGNLTLQGAVGGVHPADAERHTKAGRKVADDGVALLPTPCAQQSGNSPEEHLRKKPGRKVVTDLAILVENGLLESGGALLPTPGLSDSKTPRRGEQLRATAEGGVHMFNLADAIELQHGRDALLLQTPQARDGKGSPGEGFNKGNLLSQIIEEEEKCCHPADARLITDSAISCGMCLSHLDVEDAARSYGTQWGKYESAIRRWEQLVGPAPAPTEPNKNGNPRLSAAFSEWLMGWPAGWVTDPAIGISRNDQLRIVGNGVCSQQAVAALRYLLAIATGTHTHTPGRADVTPTLLPTPTSRDHKGANQRGDETCLHGAISAYYGEGE